MEINKLNSGILALAFLFTMTFAEAQDVIPSPEDYDDALWIDYQRIEEIMTSTSTILGQCNEDSEKYMEDFVQRHPNNPLAFAPYYYLQNCVYEKYPRKRKYYMKGIRYATKALELMPPVDDEEMLKIHRKLLRGRIFFSAMLGKSNLKDRLTYLSLEANPERELQDVILSAIRDTNTVVADSLLAILADFPENYQYPYERALNHVNKRQYRKARKILQKMLSTDSEHFDMRKYLAIAELHLKNHEEAEKQFIRAEACELKELRAAVDPEIPLHYALLLLKTDRQDAACEKLKQAKALFKKREKIEFKNKASYLTDQLLEEHCGNE